ncbi:lysophospholipid acyltransferase family protein [Flavobacterium aestuarii]|uniref:lysophospholipid acyltransferase family protein n=1 Tax=Flavobacterium aestuarii TaxID=3149227 RepID=UPI0032B47184
MKKILLYLITSIYYSVYFVIMCVMQPIEWIAFKLFGNTGLQAVFNSVAFISLKCNHILGTRFSFENIDYIPKNVPVIFVANHQSLLDTAGIIWYLRKFNCLFVTKKELAKGIPSVSYFLRNARYVLIDRSNPKQAIPQIKSLAEYIEKENVSAVIFPEGTRSKDGKPKEFAESGLKILCKYAPSAYIVPITINDSWKVYRYGYFPLSFGNHIKFTVHKPLKVGDFSFDEIKKKTEDAIVQDIKI